MASIIAFDWSRLMAEHARHRDNYLEFLRVPSCNVGIYKLAADAVDAGERVHPTEDEVYYYVVAGRAVLRGGPDPHMVKAGDVLFVPAGLEHWF